MGQPLIVRRRYFMMKRRIFLWMGLVVLFLSIGFVRETLAQESYKVKRGDTIAKIAKKFTVSQEALRTANRLPGNSIKVRQLLVIPTTEARSAAKQKNAKAEESSSVVPASASYTVKKGDTLYEIARKTGTSVSAIKGLNHLRRNSLKPGQKILLAKAAPLSEKKLKPTEAIEEEAEEDDPGDEPLLVVSPPEAEKDAGSSEDLVGKWHNPEEQKLFVKVATAFLGAPYRWGGVSLRGLDCSAFVRKIYELFDVSLPRTAREQANVGTHVAKEDLREGDLVFFNTKRSFGHVGIYIGDNKFVHASYNSRIIKIDSLEGSYFKKRFVKAVRLKGDAEAL